VFYLKQLKIDIKDILPALYMVFKISISLIDLQETENISEYAEKNPKGMDICNENLQNIPMTADTEYTRLIFLN
jgi:hypothetical protein